MLDLGAGIVHRTWPTVFGNNHTAARPGSMAKQWGPDSGAPDA